MRHIIVTIAGSVLAMLLGTGCILGPQPEPPDARGPGDFDSDYAGDLGAWFDAEAEDPSDEPNCDDDAFAGEHRDECPDYDGDGMEPSGGIGDDGRGWPTENQVLAPLTLADFIAAARDGAIDAAGWAERDDDSDSDGTSGDPLVID